MVRGLERQEEQERCLKRQKGKDRGLKRHEADILLIGGDVSEEFLF